MRTRSGTVDVVVDSPDHPLKVHPIQATRAVLAVGLILCGAMLPPGFAQAQAQSPAQGAANPIEIEFWRSTDRMATAEAYRAYLDAYPSGSFVVLARLALSRVAPNAAVAPAAAAVPAPSSASVGLR